MRIQVSNMPSGAAAGGLLATNASTPLFNSTMKNGSTASQKGNSPVAHHIFKNGCKSKVVGFES